MSLRDEIRRHGQDYRWVIGGLTLLLLVFTGIYYVIQQSRELPEEFGTELIANKVLLFPLWYVNIILILVIVFVLLRNIFKLAIERRYRILGSKFKIKLVATYFGLSLIPVLLLFFFASELLQGWGDRWFNDSRLERIIDHGNAMAQATNDLVVDTGQREAQRLLDDLTPSSLDPRRRPRLAQGLADHLNESGLDFLAVYEGPDFVHGVLNPQSGLADFPDVRPRLLVDALRTGAAADIRSLTPELGRLILAAVAVPGDPEEVRPIVVSGALMGPVLARQNEELIQTSQSYSQIRALQEDIKTSYLLTFLMMTLLILLASSWVGLFLARRITVPIQALAEGTRLIKRGELDHRVDVVADDELGELVGSFNRMIEELQRNKEQLVASNLRLADERTLQAAVLENVDAGVLLLDLDQRIVLCSRAGLQMLRQSEDEVIGKTMEEAWGRGERRKLLKLLSEPDVDSPTSSRQVRMVLGGEWRTFATRVTDLVDTSGLASGRILVLEDLTELIKAQQAAAWRDAARRVAHEIKNPLTPIKLASERLVRQAENGSGDLPRVISEAFETISREVDQMTAMVDEFSRFAKMRQPQLAVTDLRKLIGDTVQLYEGLKSGVDVSAEVADSAAEAWLDAEQIRGTLINLIDNAVAATSAPGEVVVRAAQENGALEISVTDTGPGIPPRLKDKLFLPHFSTKGRGTGLGLAIVHRIISDHHGTIRVEDNRPRGTVFRIELPTE